MEKGGGANIFLESTNHLKIIGARRVSLSTSYSGAWGLCTPVVGFNTPFCGIFSPPPLSLRRSKSSTSLCETWYNVSYISYCDQFIHAPSMEDNFFVFSVLYYNNLSSLLLTFAARTVSQSLVCLAWCTSHQDVYSNGATTITGVGETRMCVHSKTVFCACEFMFKSVLKFQKSLCFRISIVHLPCAWHTDTSLTLTYCTHVSLNVCTPW
jgi:hypothetical protein